MIHVFVRSQLFTPAVLDSPSADDAPKAIMGRPMTAPLVLSRGSSKEAQPIQPVHAYEGKPFRRRSRLGEVKSNDTSKKAVGAAENQLHLIREVSRRMIPDMALTTSSWYVSVFVLYSETVRIKPAALPSVPGRCWSSLSYGLALQEAESSVFSEKVASAHRKKTWLSIKYSKRRDRCCS